jgi:hypothetical protein
MQSAAAVGGGLLQVPFVIHNGLQLAMLRQHPTGEAAFAAGYVHYLPGVSCLQKAGDERVVQLVRERMLEFDKSVICF